MDGVLTDFDKMYKSKFGYTPAEVRADKTRGNYSVFWNKIVDDSQFCYLEWHEGGKKLVEYLNNISTDQKKKVQLCILSSSGGFDRHSEVQSQKLRWLYMNNVRWPAVIVPGRSFKAGFASSDSFMIDDTPDVITNFIDRGGSGIIHKDAQETIDALAAWL